MKTSNVKLRVKYLNGKAYLDFFFERTSKEVWNMGDTSLLVNFNKAVLSNPVVTYRNPLYNKSGYKEIRMEIILNRILGIQFECTDGIGKEVSTDLVKLVSVEFDITSLEANLNWRLIDTEIITPQFLEVQTNYSIEISSKSKTFSKKKGK
jgi:hypothetical protein